MKAFKGVYEIRYRKDLVESVNQTLGKISIVLLIIAALLTVVSFALINNTIRLSMYSRRFTIHTMKLVGASWNFIRMPFLRRAVLQGFVSALIAIIILGICMYLLYNNDPEIAVVLNMNVMATTATIMMAFGILITFLCSWLSVNKFLRMKASSLYKI